MADIIKIPLSGRIDSNNAPVLEKDVFALLEGKAGAPVVFDAAELEYISSAGLRVLLRVKKRHPDLTVTNVNPEVYDILEMTGFSEILTVEKAYRVISVEGCEVIGEGANGKVYRLDHDTVVKTYKHADALAEIQNEREVARLALIAGIPTAISYDVVKVGDSYGTVFELLDAKAFASIIAEEPDRFDWCVKEHADLLKKLHATVVPDGKLPNIKGSYQEKARVVLAMLPEEAGKKLVKLIDDVPERNTMVHGDFHTKNIVLAGDEVLLIDMDTLSVGHPVFELSQMYNSYVGFGEYNPEVISRYQGFSAETAREFWHRTLCRYMSTNNETIVKSVEDKARVVAYLRLLDWSTRHLDRTKPDDQATFELWKGELLELLDHVDTLDFEAAYDAAPGRHEIEVEATVENLGRVTAFVEEILTAVACPFKVQIQLEVAVEEIFVNIAHYAYAPNTGMAKISVELPDDPASVEITFADSGVPYNPLIKPDPDVTLSAEDRQIGGLGIYMTKKTMDGMTYEYKNGQNILTLKKLLNA